MRKAIKSHHPYTMKLIYGLRHTPVNPFNLYTLKRTVLRELSSTHITVPKKDLWLYLKAYDVVLSKMYEAKIEDGRREGSATDIDSIAEVKKLNLEISQTLVLLQKFLELNLLVEENEISKMFSFTNSFTARIYDKDSIFSDTVEKKQSPSRLLSEEFNLTKIVNRDEIQALVLPCPYVNMAFHNRNDNIEIEFNHPDENK